VPTNGQLLIGNGSTYSLATLTAGTAIGITNGAGSITINNSGVTSAVAGTGVSVSAATGAVTISIGQAVGTGNSPQFAALGINTAATATAGEVKATGTYYSGSPTGYGQYIAVQGSGSTWYNSMWRNDGSTSYLLSSAVQTTQAAAYTAIWNGFRPLYWNLSTGGVVLDGGGVGNIGGVQVGSYLGVGGAGSGTVGSITATNEITAYSSDARLKENVTLISDPLTKIMSLRGVTFDWKDETDELGFAVSYKHDVGVIAQEVEAVLPEAVRPAPFDHEYKDGKYVSKSGDNYLTVQYEKLTALLIEAVKQLKSEVDDLRARLDAQ